MKLSIYRNGIVIAAPNIDNQTQLTDALMGASKITAVFNTSRPLALQMGDYILWNAVKYTINETYEVDKNSSLSFTSTVIFEAPLYDFTKKKFKSTLNEKTFSYFGKPSAFVQLLLQNINTILPGWTQGIVDDLPEQTINFDSVDCRQALSQIAQAFNLEYSAYGKAINLQRQIGNPTSLSFSYGKGNGLYKIVRKATTDSKLVTRLWGYGGSQNLQGNYRGGATQLQFAGGYIEKNVDKYGIIEDDYVDETVFPNYTGTVNATDTGSNLNFTDAAIDFNINDVLMPGATAQIVFKTGALAGVAFDINTFDNTHKKIYFNTYTDNNYTLPNATRKPAVGDTYTLINLAMSPTYVADAEAKLKAATQAYLDKYSNELAAYDVTLSQMYMRLHNYTFYCGDTVHVKDDNLSIDADIRVTQIVYPLINPYALQLTIAQDLVYDVQTVQIKAIADNTRATAEVSRQSAAQARANLTRLSQLKGILFDTDGYFDTDNIKPLSIETDMLSVGAKSQAFQLSGAYFKISNDNFSATASGAQLIHEAIEIDGLGYTWQIASNDVLLLPDTAKAYYLYARCSAIELTGAWAVDTAQHKVDSETGYYWFLIGVIYAVADGYRGMSLTYGFASINGRTITAGRLQSLDGNNYFDLDANQWNVGASNGNGMDWNVSTPNTLTIRGAVIQRAAGVTAPIPASRGAWSASVTYYNGDQVIYNGQTFMYINPAPSSGNPTSNTAYWLVSAAQGVQGAQGQQGVKGADGTSVNINGNVATAADLPTGLTSADAGKGYLTDDDGHLHVWSGTLWRDVGEIRGANGIGISSANIAYQASTDGIKTPTGTWLSSIPALGAGQYLWTRTILNYTDGNSSTSYSVGMIGATGATGNYTEYRFAKNGSPTAAPSIVSTDLNPAGWSTAQPNRNITEYVWIVSAVKTADGSTLVAKWSLPMLFSGVQGSNGAAITAAGVWNSSTVYVGTPQLIQAILYSDNNWYLTLTTAGNIPAGTLPTNTNYYSAFGAQFQSVATGLFLATQAYIANLIVSQLSTAQDNSQPYLKSAGAEIDFWDAGTVSENDKTKALVRLGKNVGYMQASGINSSGMSAKNQSTGTYSEITSEGIFTNGSDVTGLSAATGVQNNFSIAGLLQKRNDDTNGISAGIAGLDQTNSGNSQSYGGWFNTALIGGLFIGHRLYATNGGKDNISINDTWVTYNTASNANTAYLPTMPANKMAGKIIIVHRLGNGGVQVNAATGQSIYYNSTSSSAMTVTNQGGSIIFVWTGSAWIGRSWQ